MFSVTRYIDFKKAHNHRLGKNYYVFSVMSQENPCAEITLANCELGEDNIVARYEVDPNTCQTLCQMSDHCAFWRAQDADGVLDCLLLRTNYHKVINSNKYVQPQRQTFSSNFFNYQPSRTVHA